MDGFISFAKSLALVFLWIILGILLFLFLYFIMKTIIVKIKTKKTFVQVLEDTEYIKIVDFAKWVIWDLAHGKDYLRLYGIWAFTGYYGQGKTMGCVMYAKHLQQKYPHRNIKIYSNINVQGQVKRLTSWQEMLDLPKNSIVIYDESQSDWSSTIGVNSFPEDFLRRITQVRKRQLAFFMTSPVYTRMNINLRESVNFVIECKNFADLDRWFSYRFYRSEDYERCMSDDKIKKHKYQLFKESFIASNKVYSYYDSVEEVHSIKTEEDDHKLNKKENTYLKSEMDRFRNELIKTMEERFKKLENKLN